MTFIFALNAAHVVRIITYMYIVQTVMIDGNKAFDSFTEKTPFKMNVCTYIST